MPLPQRWNQRNKKRKTKGPPEGFDYVEPVLEALEQELRDVVQERDPTKRKTEAMWPVHQLNWQKSRYIYDLYYIHGRISRQVYQYCVDQKYVDAALIAKWKKPGYEKLCSTYVIHPSHYKFGTTSICRVPYKDRSEAQRTVADPTTGCLGCFSGKDSPRNIFGNKYGQHLAAIQIAREERRQQRQAAAEAQAQAEQAEQELLQEQQEALRQQQQDEEEDDDDDELEGPALPPPPPTTTTPQPEEDDPHGDVPTDDDEDGNAETDDDDDDDDNDFGPSPAAGIWAGSQKLERQSHELTYPEEQQQQQEDDDAGANDDPERPSKMARQQVS